MLHGSLTIHFEVLPLVPGVLYDGRSAHVEHLPHHVVLTQPAVHQEGFGNLSERFLGQLLHAWKVRSALTSGQRGTDAAAHTAAELDCTRVWESEPLTVLAAHQGTAL